jgi:uncharacterized membrane protein YdjX (TVP38/TMEM64 family)
MDKAPRMPRGFVSGPLGRIVALLLLLLAFVIVPFVLWGEQLDAAAPKLLRDQPTRWAIAAIGISLLFLDVLLPIPSSVVSVTLCLLLGPALGGAAVFVGMVGAFALGLLIGRLLPEERLRHWVGTDTWDALAAKRLPARLLWIAASRPVPVLAEVTALFAGSLRVPYKASMAVAALASLLVAAAYALTTWVGMPDGTQDNRAAWSTPLLVFSAACLPAASWLGYRWIRRRLLPRP